MLNEPPEISDMTAHFVPIKDAATHRVLKTRSQHKILAATA